jgi:hypothetical protein
LLPTTVPGVTDWLTETSAHRPFGVVLTAKGDPGIVICSPLCGCAVAVRLRRGGADAETCSEDGEQPAKSRQGPSRISSYEHIDSVNVCRAGARG